MSKQEVISRNTIHKRQEAARHKRAALRDTNPNVQAMFDFYLGEPKQGCTPKYIKDKHGVRYARTALLTMSVEQVTKQFGPVHAYERELLSALVDVGE